MLIENFPPETAKRLGLAWERTSSANPDLIHVSITGYGSRGPLRDRPGYDNIVQAFSGMMAMTGEHDRGPSRLGPSVVDLGTGALAFAGACAALTARAQGGARGRRVEASLMQTALSQLGYHFTAYTMAGVVPQRAGSAVWRIVPSSASGPRTAGSSRARPTTPPGGAWRRRWARRSPAPIRPTPPRATAAAAARTGAKLEAAFLGRGAQEWAVLFDEARVACSPVQDIAELLAHPQVEAMDMMGGGGRRRRRRAPPLRPAHRDVPAPPSPGARPPDLGRSTPAKSSGTSSAWTRPPSRRCGQRRRYERRGPDERRPDGVAVLTLDNPAHRNALNDGMIEALHSGFGALSQDRSCRAMLLRGAGGTFFAGREIDDLLALREAGIDDPRRLPSPTAAERGDLLLPEARRRGAGPLRPRRRHMLATLADIAIAAEDCLIGYPEVKLGVPPTQTTIGLVRR